MTEPLLHVALLRPEIPQNTGNVGRLCAITGARLHLIHPLGFVISDRHLRRSGMDYWKSLDLREHPGWESFRETEGRRRVWLFTTRATRSFWDVAFAPGDTLLFGNEGHGCPEEVHRWIGPERSLSIPHPRPGLRSINLATSVGIAVYEMLRQLRQRTFASPSRGTGGNLRPS
ncbi:MAG: tRNA (cytidine(34)-2'-O)-methyltransferase [Puniceicoccaceae bacterium]